LDWDGAYGEELEYYDFESTKTSYSSLGGGSSTTVVSGRGYFHRSIPLSSRLIISSDSGSTCSFRVRTVKNGVVSEWSAPKILN
jgi:hypothetical protein